MVANLKESGQMVSEIPSFLIDYIKTYFKRRKSNISIRQYRPGYCYITGLPIAVKFRIDYFGAITVWVLRNVDYWGRKQYSQFLYNQKHESNIASPSYKPINSANKLIKLIIHIETLNGSMRGRKKRGWICIKSAIR